MAAIVHLDQPPTYFGFFADYCRAIVREVSVGTSSGKPQFIQGLRIFLSAISEMTPLGEHNEDGTRITLSLATDEQSKQSERILRLMGWKLGRRDSGVTVEPGDQPDAGLRQAIPGALGIDEIRMQETLEAGHEFQFEIPTENARLVGGEDWSALLKDAPVPPGGVAAAFATDWRLAKTCAGLGSMRDDAAMELLSGADLRTLANRYPDLAFAPRWNVCRLRGQRGLRTRRRGSCAGLAKAGGGKSQQSPGFLPSTWLDKPSGTLAAFYSVLSRGDAAHQRFFTKTPARAERFYAWYRLGDEFRFGQSRQN